MQAITYKDIVIDGLCRVQKIRELYMQIKPNCHAEIAFYVMTEKEEWQRALQDTISQRGFRISIQNGADKKQVLFAGVVEKAEFIREGELFFIRIKGTSFSVLCDQTEKKRTYQDISKTYAEIADSAVRESNVILVNTLNTDTKPVKPMIQYAETDWEFLMRLASHMKSVLYPNVAFSKPYIWMGLPGTEKAIELENGVMYEEHGISSQYLKIGGSSEGFVPADFEYYKITTTEHYEIGACILYQNKKWYIVEKTAELMQGELIFTYRFAKKSFISTRKQYNPLFAGMSLLGKVIETKGETLKIQFDIDKDFQNTCAYPYRWVPDTGSVMYCMPQIGTRVSVYFANEDEWSAKVVNCIRTNGAGCAKMSNPNQRTLATEHGKELFLNPDSIGMSIEESANSLQLLDDFGVRLESGMKITVKGEDEVRLKARTIEIQTPSEISFVRQ